MSNLVLIANEILVLRDVKADMTSHGGFVWPSSGPVEALDWNDTDACGHGLHGLPWGCGGDYRIGGDDAKWLVVKVSTDAGNYRHGSGDMHDKCKFRHGEVVFCGCREDATALIARYAPANSPVNWCAQITQLNRSTQTAGDESTQTAGNRSTQTAGDESTQTAGNRSTQTAGDGSTQTAGNRSTQTAGDESTQTAGDESTQTAGYGSTQTAGENSTQIQYWWDDRGNYRQACRMVGKDEAGKTYRCVCGEWVLEPSQGGKDE